MTQITDDMREAVRLASMSSEDEIEDILIAVYPLIRAAVLREAAFMFYKAAQNAFYHGCDDTDKELMKSYYAIRDMAKEG